MVWNDKIFANAIRSSKKKSVGQFWKLNAEKNEYRRKFEEMVGFIF